MKKSKSIKGLGKVAYEECRKHYQRLIGKRYPRWEKVAEDKQCAWVEAAKAVIRAHGENLK